jgi:hypothetical protein
MHALSIEKIGRQISHQWHCQAQELENATKLLDACKKKKKKLLDASRSRDQ